MTVLFLDKLYEQRKQMSLASTTSSAPTGLTPEKTLSKWAGRLLRESRPQIAHLLTAFSPEKTKEQAWKHVQKQLKQYESLSNYAVVLDETEEQLDKMITAIALANSTSRRK